jgi:phospholipase C
MSYPITSTQNVSAGQAMTMAFRPAVAGLVNVVVNASAIIPKQVSKPKGGGDPPPIPTVSLKLELFAPGAATPVFSKSDSLEVKGAAQDRLIVWGDVPAAANQLTADWTVKVTNLGELLETFGVTVRFQVLEGNLGKVDHILVLMMENRSFDHMLGYRKLANPNSDIEGLTGSEANNDSALAPQPIVNLTDTNFVTDPGHGWPDVAGALPGAALVPGLPPFQLDGDTVKGKILPSNAGFIKNFEHQVAGASPLPPHVYVRNLGAGASNSFAFVPSIQRVGDVFGARSLPTSIPSTAKSGLLGKLEIFRPGSSTAIETRSAVIGSGAISVSHIAIAADLHLAGNWTCKLTNNSDEVLDFIFDVSNSVGPPGPGAVEPATAIMGYYDQTGVPAYDSLANQFAVCDHWFASIPTDTFPNRLYAMAGGAGGLVTTPTDASVASDPPAFTVRTIFEVLQAAAVDWNIFFSDLPFALVFKALVQDAQYTSRMKPISDFFDRAATGDLPAMAWIDPNYNDVPDGTDNANDDHPPGDVIRGQQFVASVFNALAAGPAWSKTLLIITYDEHGGFYDHVEPPGTPPPDEPPGTPPRTAGPNDDDPNLRRYGLRVPTIVVTPWVEQGRVSKVTYDHTSTLRTILLRFCAHAPVVASPSDPSATTADTATAKTATAKTATADTGAATTPTAAPEPRFGGISPVTVVPSMGARTDTANSLEGLLSLDAPRAAIPIGPISRAPAIGTASPVSGIGATIRLSILGF